MKNLFNKIDKDMPLSLLFKIINFLKKLKAKTSFYRKNTLKENDYRFIGDKASYFEGKNFNHLDNMSNI